MKYLVVEHSTKEALENEVMDNFKRGYACQGSVNLTVVMIPGMYGSVSHQFIYLQAMVYVGGINAKSNS